MRDPNRIAKILQRLEPFWQQHADWRLGQLLLNLAEWADEDLWNLEDDRLAEVLEDHLARKESRAEIQ